MSVIHYSDDEARTKVRLRILEALITVGAFSSPKRLVETVDFFERIVTDNVRPDDLERK